MNYVLTYLYFDNMTRYWLLYSLSIKSGEVNCRRWQRIDSRDVKQRRVTGAQRDHWQSIEHKTYRKAQTVGEDGPNPGVELAVQKQDS